jgi:hypothetical protein
LIESSKRGLSRSSTNDAGASLKSEIDRFTTVFAFLEKALNRDLIPQQGEGIFQKTVED